MKVETEGSKIRIELDLPLDPERVWKLIAEKEHRINWWGDHVDLEARPSGKFREVWSDGGRPVVTSGEVTRCDPPAALEMTWADNDWPGQTQVAFSLVEHGGGTRLRLEHRGWGVHQEERRRELIDAHARGWSTHLSRLEEYTSTAGLRG